MLDKFIKRMFYVKEVHYLSGFNDLTLIVVYFYCFNIYFSVIIFVIERY